MDKRASSRRGALLTALLGILAWAGPGFAAEANLVVNHDFEAAGDARPPRGWAMWGAAKYKTPANYTRDTARPHGGAACFRIHHPAGTAGYVVLAPESAIRPREGMQYTVNFWARSDRPGNAVFGWDGYRRLTPYAEASAPGMSALAVGPEWKPFEFTVHEGWDLFADECRYLLLVFKAAGKNEEERTLWIDDVVVTERPSERKERLVNPLTLSFPPLEHRLKEGTELSIVLDATKTLREAPRAVGGVSFHRVAGWAKLPYDKSGRYVLPQGIEEAIREMRLPMTRFYGVGDEPFGAEGAIDRAAELCRKLNIPTAATPLELETQGATSALPPEAWEKAVKHSVEKGHGFERWEIANEPYLGRPGMVFTTPDDYVAHFVAVARAIRAVQPNAKIGLPIHHRNPGWGNYLLKKAAGEYDFVVPHYYWFASVHRESFEDIVLAGNWAILDDAQRVNALIRRYNPERPVVQYDTEWGMHSSGPQGERPDAVARNGNVVGMMHRAVRLIHLLREGPLAGASSWEMFTYRRSPGFGFFAADAPDLRSMHYWLYYHWNRHAGRWVVEIDGTAPYYDGRAAGKTFKGPQTPAVATLSEDRKTLFLVVANGSWAKPAPARVELRGFNAGGVTATALTQDDRDASPLVERMQDVARPVEASVEGNVLKMTLPAHAVVFVRVEGK